MKRIYLVVAMLCTSMPVFAGSCVALDYQEMKDMSAEDLTKEACKVRKEKMKYFEEGMDNLRFRGPKLYPDAQQNFDTCDGQAARIERVLSSKGVAKEALNEACKAANAAK